MTDLAQSVSRERQRHPLSGWFMLLVNFALLFGGLYLLKSILSGGEVGRPLWPPLTGIGSEILAILFFGGYFTLQPNEARVLLLFGRYHGTVRRSGFFWANPFYSRSRSQASSPERGKTSGTALPSRTLSSKISLRAR